MCATMICQRIRIHSGRKGMAKCGLISDLHVEQVKFYQHEKRSYYRKNRSKIDALTVVPPPSQPLDILFIAGDLCEFRFRDLWHETLRCLTRYAQRLVVVDGNHEAYRSNYQKMAEYVHALELAFPNVTFLNNARLRLHRQGLGYSLRSSWEGNSQDAKHLNAVYPVALCTA